MTAPLEVDHAIGAPLERVRAAILSEAFAPALEAALRAQRSRIVSVALEEISRREGAVLRVLRFGASSPMPFFQASSVPGAALTWRERFTYREADDAASWQIELDPKFAKYFEAAGGYRLVATGSSTRREVRGALTVHAPLMAGLVERIAVADVKKTYDAERDALRD